MAQGRDREAARSLQPAAPVSNLLQGGQRKGRAKAHVTELSPKTRPFLDVNLKFLARGCVNLARQRLCKGDGKGVDELHNFEGKGAAVEARLRPLGNLHTHNGPHGEGGERVKDDRNGGSRVEKKRASRRNKPKRKKRPEQEGHDGQEKKEVLLSEWYLESDGGHQNAVSRHVGGGRSRGEA